MFFFVYQFQEWNDYKLTWTPSQYGGIDVVEIPSSDIWVPDIVLYNNADGTYEVNTITKAHVVNIDFILKRKKRKKLSVIFFLSFGTEQLNGILLLYINLIVLLILNIIHLMNKIVYLNLVHGHIMEIQYVKNKIQQKKEKK